MPRIPISLLRRAYAIDPFLPPLLGPCRDLHAAQRELRWLREHVQTLTKARRPGGHLLAESALLRQLVTERASGKPLQYILGTEFFGDLEILCKPGVLIPRPDTAASITHLVGLLNCSHNLPSELRVLDLCTGTGCIPLLFRHELYAACSDTRLRVLGVDISSRALALANENLLRVNKAETFAPPSDIHFIQADVMANPFDDREEGFRSLKTALSYKQQPNTWDILISNPPYISPSAYWQTTTRAVRNFEPKLALVPPPILGGTHKKQGDSFYPRLLDIARDAEAKVVLLEIGDLDQAHRVAREARNRDIFDGIEIWREQPGTSADDTTDEDGFLVYGKGHARSVVCWRGAGTSWLGKPVKATS